MDNRQRYKIHCELEILRATRDTVYRLRREAYARGDDETHNTLRRAEWDLAMAEGTIAEAVFGCRTYEPPEPC